MQNPSAWASKKQILLQLSTHLTRKGCHPHRFYLRLMTIQDYNICLPDDGDAKSWRIVGRKLEHLDVEASPRLVFESVWAWFPSLLSALGAYFQSCSSRLSLYTVLTLIYVYRITSEADVLDRCYFYLCKGGGMIKNDERAAMLCHNVGWTCWNQV